VKRRFQTFIIKNHFYYFGISIDISVFHQLRTATARNIGND
jgi:hypothetical protein